MRHYHRLVDMYTSSRRRNHRLLLKGVRKRIKMRFFTVSSDLMSRVRRGGIRNRFDGFLTLVAVSDLELRRDRARSHVPVKVRHTRVQLGTAVVLSRQH